MKKKDKIDLLLEAYKKTSAARIEKERKEERKLKAEKDAREDFIAALKKKIVEQIRPRMQNLAARLKATGFEFSIKEWTDGIYVEEYSFTATQEKDTRVWLSFRVEQYDNTVLFARGGEFGEDFELKLYERYVKLNEITEDFITKEFIKGFEKICMPKK